MDINDSINNLKIKLFDINSIYPKCNSKLTSILGLKCDSRSGYITYNIINDSDLYKNKEYRQLKPQARQVQMLQACLTQCE